MALYELTKTAITSLALSNQWSVSAMAVVDEVIAKLPPGSLSYAKTITATRRACR
ncbi:MAG: hypothetical protein ABSF98_13630 [Bryobacteraceae bacterium]